jgi:hypothetical protein
MELDFNVEFWDKPMAWAALKEHMKDLASRVPSYREMPWEQRLDLHLAEREQMEVRVNGGNATASLEPLELDCELARYQLEAYFMHPKWLPLVQKRGAELYKILLPQEIGARYAEARGRCHQPENVAFRFTIPEDCAGAGFEVLYDKTRRDFLALQHPLSCRLSNVSTDPNTGRLDRERLNNRKEPLRVLLIAANIAGEESKLPPTNEIDEEVEQLAKLIPQWFQEHSVVCAAPVVVRSGEATLENLMKKLDKPYDIVHFAGHGVHNDELTQTGIYLWSGNQAPRRERLCTLGELEDLFRHRPPRFVFLNACSTGAHASREAFTKGPFLGVAHCVLKAGIPCVLGHQVPVSPFHAFELALAFYEGLADKGELDIALLEARKKLRGLDPQDAVYLSSALYLQ